MLAETGVSEAEVRVCEELAYIRRVHEGLLRNPSSWQQNRESSMTNAIVRL